MSDSVTHSFVSYLDARRTGQDLRQGTDVLAKYRQAVAHEDAGEAELAAALYRDLQALYPEEVALQLRLALLEFDANRYEVSEQLLLRALRLNPEEALVHNGLGATYRALERRESAESAFLQALKLRPGFLEARHNLGLLYEEMGRTDEAEHAYREVLVANPRYFRSLTRLGVISRGRNEFDVALDYLDQALSIEPGYAEAQYYRGDLLQRMQRPKEAAAAFARAAINLPGNIDAAMATAHSLREAGRYEESVRIYWDIVERHPERVEVHELLNQTAWESDQRSLYLRSFDHARQKLGDVTELLMLEAGFRLRRHEYSRAEALMRKAQKLEPDRPDVLGLLARTLAGQQRYDEGLPLFDVALKGAPGVAIHRQEYGFALLRAGRTERAVEIFEQGLRLQPADQLLLAGVMLAYREIEDPRYALLYDFDRYIRFYDLGAPDGYPDAATFNAMLARELDALHHAKVAPIAQTLRGGTQTVGRLFARRTEIIEQIRARIQAAVLDYCSWVKTSDNPVSRGMTERLQFTGSWSCRLDGGGFHSNHVHPEGWLSSAYYVRLPEGIEHSDDRAGWLKFGESSLALGANDFASHFIAPKVGRLVLFPSFYWHGTVPFKAGHGDRLTIAFDVGRSEE